MKKQYSYTKSGNSFELTYSVNGKTKVIQNELPKSITPEFQNDFIEMLAQRRIRNARKKALWNKLDAQIKGGK